MEKAIEKKRNDDVKKSSAANLQCGKLRIEFMEYLRDPIQELVEPRRRQKDPKRMLLSYF